jgi:hypothetical protein
LVVPFLLTMVDLDCLFHSELELEPHKASLHHWYRKETDSWAEFGKETPFGRKFSSKHSVKVPAVGGTPSFGRRDVLCLEKETFGNT